MPVFTYKAKDRRGEIIADTMEAENQHTVITKLQADGYYPLSIRVEQVKKKITPPTRPSGQKKIGAKEFTVFTRQLSSLLNSGMPLVRCLDVLIRQFHNQKLKEVLVEARNDVREGKSFSEALAKFPRIFPRLYVSMVKAGELGGVLEQVLERLADFYERQQQLRSQVVTALAYPAIMIAVGFLTVIFLFTYVIPKFVYMFAEIERALPFPTRILVATSSHLKSYGLFYLSGFIVIFSLLRQAVKTKEGKIIYDRIRLKLPVLGVLIQKLILSRITRTLGTLIQNGVPVLTALDMVQEVVDNEIIRQDLKRIRGRVESGEGLSGPLAKSPFFPPLIADMVAVGEESGQVEVSLIRISDSLDREIENLLKTLTSLLEPVLILCLALVVGFIVLAMLLPVFEMSSMVQ